MKKLYFISIFLLLSIQLVSADCLKRPTLSPEVQQAFQLYYRIGEEVIGYKLWVKFSPDSRAQESAFTYVIPDTIWIKRPKKNPEEGKHYVLNYVYHGKVDEYRTYPKTNIRVMVPNAFSEAIVITKIDGNKAFFTSASGREIVWNLSVRALNLEISSAEFANYLKSTMENYPIYKKQLPSDNFINRYYIDKLVFQLKTINGSLKNASYFTYTDNGKYYESKGQYSAGDNSSYECFISKTEGDKYYNEIDYKYNVQPKLDSQKDSTFSLCIVMNGLYFPQNGETLDFHNSKIFVYGAENIGGAYYKIDFVYHGKIYKITEPSDWKEDKLDSAQIDKLELLKRRGSKGSDIRKELALIQDKIAWDKEKKVALEAQRMNAEKREKLAEELKKDGIFLIEVGEAESSTRATGITFTVFNCFEKPIKYVYFSACAVNSVGDVQKDHFGRSIVSDDRPGIINPGETRVVYNNEMFWDEGYKISDVKLLSIRFVFTDGTEKSYTPWSTIKQHYRSSKL